MQIVEKRQALKVPPLLRLAFRPLFLLGSVLALLAIPFFVLAGAIMAEGGIAHRLVNLARLFVGTLRGGLALVNIIASTFFGGVSGSSVADTASEAAQAAIQISASSRQQLAGMEQISQAIESISAARLNSAFMLPSAAM